MKFANEKIIVSADMSANFESEPILLDQIYGFSFQSVFTGSPNGTFKLQASNDDVKLGFDVYNWTDIADSSQAITAAGDITWNFDGCFFKWVKVVYTFSSGTGSCDITYASKGV